LTTAAAAAAAAAAHRMLRGYSALTVTYGCDNSWHIGSAAETWSRYVVSRRQCVTTQRDFLRLADFNVLTEN